MGSSGSSAGSWVNASQSLPPYRMLASIVSDSRFDIIYLGMNGVRGQAGPCTASW